MEREELKNLQSPLKQKYKVEPEAALVTLKAQGRIGEGITCKIETGKAIAKAGLHPATGGDGLSICSGDMLLEALVACAGVTMNAVSTSMGLKLEEGIVTAEGDLDFRGTLGVSKEAPVGFQKIKLSFDLKTAASEEEIKSLIKLTERYCVVLQTIKNRPAIETSFTSKN
jgi:uncharacterized OsmC-like protein